jgi:demethylmenaquinone methyltransferase/2-methoxy-6-polyprenyl-1,4-benzoquinol methylase
LALAYDRASGGRIAIVSADFCHEMLVIGRRKGARRGAADRLTFVEADAQQLPFADDRFQMVTVAFGLRNIADTDRGLREMTRVCRPGGKVAVLEFSEPRWRPLRAVYLWYLRRVLPKIGRLLAGSRERAYDYLSQSVVEFPSGRAMADRLRAAGLESVRYHPLTLGIATLYVGTKASRTNNESTPP